MFSNLGRPIRVTSIEVIIPLYNSESWIEGTLESIKVSASNSRIHVSFLVVNDGSQDKSLDMVERWSKVSGQKVSVIDQRNQGRFLARLNGARHSESEWLFFVDSRMILDDDLFTNLEQLNVSDIIAINGLTRTDERGGLEVSFWEVPTKLFWGTSIKSKHPISFSNLNFDRLPKGTGLLLVRRKVFLDLCHQFLGFVDPKLMSDDTKVLRGLSNSTGFVFDPRLRAVYIPRQGVISFFTHVFGRGVFFWDSFKNSSGVMNLIANSVLIFPLGLMVYLGVTSWFWGFGAATWATIGLGISFLSAIVLLAKLRGASHKSVASFLVLIWPVIPIFWVGVISGALKRRDFQK